MTRFRFVDDNAADGSADEDGTAAPASSDSSDDGEKRDDEYSDSDSDDEEPPHPLGFPSSCRYTVDMDPPESLPRYLSRAGYAFPEIICKQMNQSELSLWSPEYKPPVPQYPPIATYVDPNTVSSNALMQWSLVSKHQELVQRKRQLKQQHKRTGSEDDDDDDDDEDWYERELDDVRYMLQRTSLLDPNASPGKGFSEVLSPETKRGIAIPYQQMVQDEIQIRKEMEHLRKNMHEDHSKRMQAFKALLQRQDDQAQKIRDENERLEREAKQQAREQEALEEEQREQQRKQDELQEQKNAAQKEADDEKIRKAQELEDQLVQEKIRVEKEISKERAYLERAHKLMKQLVSVRASVEPFEKSTDMTTKKRRLQMKKLVNGKVNTLTENAAKIREVASEVSSAIAQARKDDEIVKQQQHAASSPSSSPPSPPEARGKRYLVDLLCSKVIVRVQAEGFNGQRGDGFPLAAMLAQASVDNEDLGPVLAAHIYTVCPTAIPSLPSPSPDASEEELMESLGMLKKDDGTFETFERFLTRTESIISIMADIMASNPPNHKLMGGHESAIKWLSRFLSLLPPAPDELPLLTAPVLDAFLTGAGHMLANKHGEEFQTHINTIMNDVLSRLDEGPIGAPSATRLKKTVGDGFNNFKSKLPSRALPELYYGANGDGGHGASTAAVGGAGGGGGHQRSKSGAQDFFSGASNSNPFAPSNASTSSTNPFAPSSGGPFAVSGNSNTGAKSDPFGTSNKMSGFGVGGTGNMGGGMDTDFGASAAAPSPFTSNMAAPAPSPFTGAAAPAPSPFTQSSNFAMSSAPSPFSQGGSAAAPSPFTSTQSSNPFNSGGMSAPTPSPFSQSGTTSTMPFPGTSASAPSPFSMGNSNTGSSSFSSSPFVAGAAAAPSPFSSNASPFSKPSGPSGQFGNTFGVAPAPSPSPFSAPSPSPFSTQPSGAFNQQQSGGGRGRGKQPCKFFASGTCKFGNNCRFSHDQPAGGSVGSAGFGGGGNMFGNSPFGSFR